MVSGCRWLTTLGGWTTLGGESLSGKDGVSSQVRMVAEQRSKPLVKDGVARSDVPDPTSLNLSASP